MTFVIILKNYKTLWHRGRGKVCIPDSWSVNQATHKINYWLDNLFVFWLDLASKQAQFSIVTNFLWYSVHILLFASKSGRKDASSIHRHWWAFSSPDCTKCQLFQPFLIREISQAFHCSPSHQSSPTNLLIWLFFIFSTQCCPSMQESWSPWPFSLKNLLQFFLV